MNLRMICAQLVQPISAPQPGSGWRSVDLQQIKTRHTPESSGGFDLLRPAGSGGDPDLVGREQAWRPIELGESVTNHLLGRAVHGRGIDQASPGIKEGANHLR